MPSWKNIFRSEPVAIEKTPVIIREINSLSQLVTLTYTDEVVMSEAKKGSGLPSIMNSGIAMIMVPPVDRLVLIGRGQVIAGIDLKGLSENDVHPVEDSIHITLPHARILSTIINPSGFEIFDEEGEWSEKEVTMLKLKIKNELKKRALRANVLVQAEERSSEIIEAYLKSTGFNKVKIAFRN